MVQEKSRLLAMSEWSVSEKLPCIWYCTSIINKSTSQRTRCKNFQCSAPLQYCPKAFAANIARLAFTTFPCAFAAATWNLMRLSTDAPKSARLSESIAVINKHSQHVDHNTIPLRHEVRHPAKQLPMNYNCPTQPKQNMHNAISQSNMAIHIPHDQSAFYKITVAISQWFSNTIAKSNHKPRDNKSNKILVICEGFTACPNRPLKTQHLFVPTRDNKRKRRDWQHGNSWVNALQISEIPEMDNKFQGLDTHPIIIKINIQIITKKSNCKHTNI